jgi:hypothetical protein
MNKIYNEWWAHTWRRIEEDFQQYFNTTIRPKLNLDAPACLSLHDIEFKEVYERTCVNTFNCIAAAGKQRQEQIYNVCIGDDGLIDPKYGNTKIRQELARDTINSLDTITGELNSFMWSNIDKMINWMRQALWNLPEIRMEMIGPDENVEIKLMSRSFDSLIQRLARPATNIFLTYPRSKIPRTRVMQEFQMELLILDKFIVNGRICERGIMQFLADGKLGHFDIDIRQSNIVVDVVNDGTKAKPSDKASKNNYGGNTSEIHSFIKKTFTSNVTCNYCNKVITASMSASHGFQCNGRDLFLHSYYCPYVSIYSISDLSGPLSNPCLKHF